MKTHWMVRVLPKTLTLIPQVGKTLTLIPEVSSHSIRSASSTSSPAFGLKNVTRSNFNSALSDLRGLVRDADFVAIDLEMTGVTSAPWRESFPFDRFDVRYLKVKDSAEKFAVVQFGVCPFRWDPQKQSFIAHPHNFYIFPRQEILGDFQSREFLCQTTSLDFLAKYQFDFNACIGEGVSYLSKSQEVEALRRLASTYADGVSGSLSDMRKDADAKFVRMADIFFSERMKNKIGEWRGQLLQAVKDRSEWQQRPKNSNQKLETIFFKMRPALVLSDFTSHQLRLIQLVVEKHFKDLIYVRATGEASCSKPLIVYADSPNDRDMLMQEVKNSLHEDAERKIKAAIGFRHVIDLLSEEQKLIIGHNCFLDIAHIHSQFVGPLPLTINEYVFSIRKYFPHIIDTKVLLNANNVFQGLVKKSSTSLSKAFALLCPEIASGVRSSGLADKPCVKVEVQVDDKRSLTWNSGAKHEAGYDAFMTGCVFAQACSHLGVDLKLHPSLIDLRYSDKLEKYINLLYLSWINGDIVDLRTGTCSPDFTSSQYIKARGPEILFSNIVLLWGLPSKLRSSDVKECISKVFGANSVTSIYHLDETAAFVQFSRAELVNDFLELKETLERSSDPISVLHPLSKILEGGATRAANYEVYREICSSPISKVVFADQAEAVGVRTKLDLVVESPRQYDKSSDEGSDMDNAGNSVLHGIAITN